MSQPTFALVGAAGFVAPRHLDAIKHVGGKLIAAYDPHDAVGVLDKYDRHTEFFTNAAEFERLITGPGIDWLVVCSPNETHFDWCEVGVQAGCRVLCEKPLALTVNELDDLADLPYAKERVFTVLQLRYSQSIRYLREHLLSDRRPEVEVRYATPRGLWYEESWKMRPENGGLITNIGIHLLDAVTWLFGGAQDCGLTVADRRRAAGWLKLARADVKFTLSIETDVKKERTLVVNGHPRDLAFELEDFENLHRTVYEETLAGRGVGIEDVREAIRLAERLRDLVPSSHH